MIDFQRSGDEEQCKGQEDTGSEVHLMDDYDFVILLTG